MTKKFCYNCGKVGHIYTNCRNPVMSYGIILYKKNQGVPKYLMVQRTYTPDFKELIRGRFDFEDAEYIKLLISRITLQEINFITNYSHQILYQNIQKFCSKKNKFDKKAKINYKKLIDGFINSSGILIKFDLIVREENPIYFLEPDWGFPKGRREYRKDETDLDCAIREVIEETGVSPNKYQIIPDYYVTEVMTGSNNIRYAHRYFIAECPTDITTYIDPFNKHQAGEIRKLGWFTVEETIAMMRPYHKEKKKILLRVHRKLTGDVIVIDLENNNTQIKISKRKPIPVKVRRNSSFGKLY